MNSNILPRCVAATVILCGGLSFSQTKVDLRSQSKSVDFGDSSYTRPVKVGTSLAPTCTTGELFFRSTAAPGSNLYACTATNTWTLLAGGMTGSSATTVGQLPTFADTTGKLLGKYSGTGLLKASAGVVTTVAGSAADCVKVDGSSGPCATGSGSGDTIGSSSTVAGQMATFADITGKLLGKYSGTGVLKSTAGVVNPVAGAASDCVKVDGSSGSCGSSITPGSANTFLASDGTATVWRQFSAGASGAVSMTFSPGATTVDVDTAVVPRKAVSETIGGLWTFSRGILAPPMASPASPAEGLVFIDNSTNLLKWFAGGAMRSASGSGDTVGSSATTVGQMATFADTTGKLLGKYTGTGLLKSVVGVVSAVTGGPVDCVRTDGSTSPCGDTTGSSATTTGQLPTFADTTGKLLGKYSGTGLLKASAGVVSTVAGTATDCVKVDGSSGACGAGSGDTVGSSSTVAGQMPTFADTTGKLLGKYTGTGLLKADGGVVSAVIGTSTDCVKADGSSGPCGDTTGPSATTAGQLPTFADTTGKLLGKYSGTGLLKASAGVVSTVDGSAADCVKVDGSSGPCGTGDTVGSSSTDVGQIATFADTTGKLLGKYSGSGVLKSTAGVVNPVTGIASDCVKVDGSSGSCGSGLFTPQAPIMLIHEPYSTSTVSWATGVVYNLTGTMITVPYSFTVGRLATSIGTAVAGASAWLGVYSVDGLTKHCAVTIDAGTTGVKSGTCSTPITLPAGSYYLAWAAGDAAARFIGVNTQQSVEDSANAGTNANYFDAANSATAGGLPATLGTIAKSNLISPIVFSILAN